MCPRKAGKPGVSPAPSGASESKASRPPFVENKTTCRLLPLPSSQGGWLLPQGWPGKPVKKYELGFNNKDQLKKGKKKKLSPAQGPNTRGEKRYNILNKMYLRCPFIYYLFLFLKIYFYWSSLQPGHALTGNHTMTSSWFIGQLCSATEPHPVGLTLPF